MKNKRTKLSFFGKMIRIVLIILLFPILFVRAIILSVKNRKKRKTTLDKVKIMTISQIDTLEGEEFEIFLQELFKLMGYSVSLTKKAGDYGADLVLKKGKNIIAVQAKRYSKTVGAHAVQEIMGAKKHYSANSVMVVTNNYFSKEAVSLALENDIKLVDRTTLENLIKKYNVEVSRKKCRFCATNLEEMKQIESRFISWI